MPTYKKRVENNLYQIVKDYKNNRTFMVLLENGVLPTFLFSQLKYYDTYKKELAIRVSGAVTRTAYTHNVTRAVIYKAIEKYTK